MKYNRGAYACLRTWDTFIAFTISRTSETTTVWSSTSFSLHRLINESMKKDSRRFSFQICWLYLSSSLCMFVSSLNYTSTYILFFFSYHSRFTLIIVSVRIVIKSDISLRYTLPNYYKTSYVAPTNLPCCSSVIS